jgi:hypothetical protein
MTMKKTIARLVFVLPVTLLVFAGPLSSAEANTHTHIQADGCKAYNASEVNDIDMLVTGARTLVASARAVICDVPRVSTVAGGNTESYGYRVYGSNVNGASTTCSVTAFDGHGNVRAQASFTTSSALYNSNTLFLSGAAVQTNDPISLICTLPKSGNGVLFGYSSVQSS